MTERRFTDRDVALILRRAAELDKDPPGQTLARGLNLADLREIAVEVGINPEMVTRAASELESQGGVRSLSLLGDSLAHRQVRAVPGEMDRDSLGRLVQAVDREVPAQGTVTEALGAVRWNSQGRLLSRQVSLEPGEGETLIRVEERFEARVRAMLHGIPAGYAAMAGFITGVELLGGAGPGFFLGALSSVAGWAIGGAVWKEVARRSKRRVHALAEVLQAETGEEPPTGE
jgi:hypothetical protein